MALHVKNSQCPLSGLFRRREVEVAPYSMDIYTSMSAVPRLQWDAVARNGHPFLRWAFLGALEAGRGHGDAYRYVILRDQGTPMAVCPIQMTTFEGEPVERFIPEGDRVLGLVADHLGILGRRISKKVLVVGLPLATGVAPWTLAEGCSEDRARLGMQLALKRIVAGLGCGRVGGIILKDFPARESRENAMERALFASLPTEPNMVLRRDPQWTTFDRYLEDLRSKFRVKAKRAYTKSSNLTCVDMSVDRILNERASLEGLYRQVLARCDYRTGTLDPAAYVELKTRFPREFSLHGYFLGDRMVGFRTAFLADADLHALTVGIDYPKNEEHGIYSRMLYDYVRQGIGCGTQAIHFGRTATEIKSGLGAKPEPMCCRVGHVSPLLNAGIRFIARSVTLPAPTVREPFRTPPQGAQRHSGEAVSG